MSENPEAGYHYLPTEFTGTSIPQLSGNSDFPIISCDMGVANLIADAELKAPPGSTM